MIGSAGWSKICSLWKARVQAHVTANAIKNTSWDALRYMLG